MDLEDTIAAVLADELPYGAVADYCGAMENTPEALAELKAAIESYDLPDLYACLFSAFRDALPAAEEQSYREKCRLLFDPEIFRLLTGEA